VGRLKRLHVNFQSLLDEHGDVYDVYGKNSTPVSSDFEVQEK